MTSNRDSNSGFAVVNPDEVEDHYEGSDVPGEFRRLTADLGSEQLSVTLIRVPPHSDFEQGTGHFHDEVEELYLVGDFRARSSTPTPPRSMASGRRPRTPNSIASDAVDTSTRLEAFWP
jgi:hypothetical protein